MSKQLNRRIFLRGLGGAVLAAPFLSSVWERTAKGDTTATGKAFIVMFTHYGCITNNWFPEKPEGELTAADLESTSLAPLAPFAKKLLMPRGIRSMNEWTANLSRGQGNDSHTQIVGSFFSCQPVTPNSNDPMSFNRATKFEAKSIGPSLDHVMAQQISPQGTPLLLNTAGQNDAEQSAISYSAPTTLYRGLNATQAFSSLTGLFKAGEPTSPDDYAAIRGKSLVDLVKDDLQTLERYDMSRADKEKLAVWKELLHSTGNVMVSAQCDERLGEMLGATADNASKARGGGFGTDVLTTKIAGDLDGADIYSAIAALAAACNANPVIFLKYPGNYNFSGLGINMDAHSVSHRLDNPAMIGNCLPNAIKMLLDIDAYYARKFANLVGMLEGIPQGNGTTVLDGCAVVWFNEMSDGNAHNLNNAPIIQAGSAGGYFKTGQIINVDPDSTPSRGNSMAQCANGTGRVDGTTQATGTDPKIGNAPINKYFCNIMNAMGVKAGPDGFPAKGGSAEVTHYGYSDKTEDFIGGEGAVKGATIHNPGEFTELKA